MPLLGWWFGFGPFAPLPTRGLLPPSDACFCLWAKLSSSGCAAPGAGLAVVEKFPTRPLARQGRHCLPFWGFAVPSSLPCRAGTRACHAPSWTVVSGLTPRVGCSCAAAHANDGRHRACNLVVLWLRESRCFWWLVFAVRRRRRALGKRPKRGWRCAWFSRRRWGCLGVFAVGAFWGFLRWCSIVGCFWGKASYGGCASSAGLGHWGLLPKRWLRLGRARPRAPRARPTWVGDPGGLLTRGARPRAAFGVCPEGFPVGHYRKHTPGSGTETTTQSCCTRSNVVVGVTTSRRHRNPRFDPNLTTTPFARQRTPHQIPPADSSNHLPNTVARKENPSLACAAALPHHQPITTPQPTAVGHQPQPPTGVKAGHPAHTRNQTGRPQPQAREASGNTATSTTNHRPTRSGHTQPPAGRVCQPPTHHQPKKADPNH